MLLPCNHTANDESETETEPQPDEQTHDELGVLEQTPGEKTDQLERLYTRSLPDLSVLVDSLTPGGPLFKNTPLSVSQPLVLVITAAIALIVCLSSSVVSSGELLKVCN